VKGEKEQKKKPYTEFPLKILLLVILNTGVQTRGENHIPTV